MSVQSTMEAVAGETFADESSDPRHFDTVGSATTESVCRSSPVSHRRFRARDRVDSSDVALLVEAAGAGNQDAWNALVERFASTVWAIARGHRLNSSDAADVFQTTWLRLLENLDRIEQPERVGAWIGTTARRECLRVLRVSSRQVPNGSDFEVLPDTTSQPHEGNLIAGERSRVVNHLVDQLPVRSQLLLRLLSADSPLSYRDISTALSMPIGSIGPTRARALEQLRRLAISGGISLEDVFFA